MFKLVKPEKLKNMESADKVSDEEERALVLPSTKERISRVKFVVIVAIVIIMDQATKVLIIQRFSLGESLPIISGFFSLTYIRNPGIAFGMLPAESGWLHSLLLLIPVTVSSVLVFWYGRLLAHQEREGLALSLIVGGALSNVYDRFRLGSVVDFLDFHWQNKVHYPAFNFADTLICTGIAILFLVSFRKERKDSLKHV